MQVGLFYVVDLVVVNILAMPGIHDQDYERVVVYIANYTVISDTVRPQTSLVCFQWLSAVARVL